MPSEREVQPGKEMINHPELDDNSEAELKNINNKRKEEKRGIFKMDELKIEEDRNKNGFLDYQNKSERDSDYKSKKGNRKNYTQINRINKKRNTYLIIAMIVFTLKASNNNMIDFQFSNITLKIRGPGFRKILYSSFINNNNRPNIIYINGNQNITITHSYYFNEINNTVNIIWNNSIDNCGNMFKECSDIIEIDLSNFDTSNVKNMSYMFYGCSILTSLNIYNFNTSKVEDMKYMFYECRELSSLNLSNFDTSKVEDMQFMFSYCSKISSLNLSNFDTSIVTDMKYMFFGCSKLSSLNLSNFDTSNVIDMQKMFSDCSKLSSLNLSNFDTSTVTDMYYMFTGCSQLTSLILSNFNTSKVKSMENMFSGCPLEYIHLKNFIENDSLDTLDIFKSVPENVVVCLNENSNKVKQSLMNKLCPSFDCLDDWKKNQKKKVTITNICYDIFNKSILYKCEYQGLYYENSINGKLINNSTISYCICKNKQCSSCSNLSFIDLKYKIYEKEDEINLNGDKKCYKDPIGYYLDINEYIYKKCYYSCKKCEIQGNNITHNCIECNNNYPIEFKVNNYSNCYEKCSYYYYFDENNNYYCTNNNSCPNEYPILDKIECKKRNKITKIKEILDLNFLNNKIAKEEKIKHYDSVLKDIEENYISKYYDTSYLVKYSEEIIEIENFSVILTTTLNQKNNINSNITNIDLGECEDLLRRTYNLSSNEILYIKMVEVSQEGMRIPKVEYDIYAKLNGENLEKLRLNSCKNKKISLLIPINNIDNIDKLNPKSGYYNDFCYTATSEYGTDISLKDRQNEYPSIAVCQDGCDFADYNSALKKAKCSCYPKESSSSFAEIKIDKKKLLDNFKNIKNIANLKLLKFVKVLFCKTGIEGNVGFYIFIAILIFHQIILILFYKKKFDLLQNKIKKLILAINYKKHKKGDEKEKKVEDEGNIIRFNEVNDNNIINIRNGVNNSNDINNNSSKEILKKVKKIQKKKKKKKEEKEGK